MDLRDIGIVYNQLRTRRVIYSDKVGGRRRSEAETDAARILSRAGGRLGDLEQFLSTQGLRLVIQDIQALGISGDGVAYIAIRDTALSAPAHICGDQVVRRLVDARRNEKPDHVVPWAVFLSLLLLQFLYTLEDRPIEAVSRHLQTSVDRESFLAEARRRIEALRQTPSGEEPRRASIIHSLTANEREVEGRVVSFLGAMEELGVLETTGDEYRIDSTPLPVYRQTLWSAVDLAQNFRRYAPHLLIEDDAAMVDVVAGTVETPVSEFELDIGESLDDGDAGAFEEH